MSVGGRTLARRLRRPRRRAQRNRCGSGSPWIGASTGEMNGHVRPSEGQMKKLFPSDSSLKDQAILRWSCLESEPEACAVVSERMELVYLNGAARQLVQRGAWFGKHCFEALAVADNRCAFDCPKMRAVNESSEAVYAE